MRDSAHRAANPSFLSLLLVVFYRRPLMVVKYNTKLLSYFNCKRGKYKGSNFEFKCAHGKCVHSNILYISISNIQRRGQGLGKRYDYKCPTYSTFPISEIWPLFFLFFIFSFLNIKNIKGSAYLLNGSIFFARVFFIAYSLKRTC